MNSQKEPLAHKGVPFFGLAEATIRGLQKASERL